MLYLLGHHWLNRSVGIIYVICNFPTIYIFTKDDQSYDKKVFPASSIKCNTAGQYVLYIQSTPSYEARQGVQPNWDTAKLAA